MDPLMLKITLAVAVLGQLWGLLSMWRNAKEIQQLRSHNNVLTKELDQTYADQTKSARDKYDGTGWAPKSDGER